MLPVFDDQRPFFQRPADAQRYLVEVERLDHIIVRAHPHRLDGVLHVVQGRHDDDGEVRVLALWLRADHLHPVHLGHFQVREQNRIGAVGFQQLERFKRRHRALALISLGRQMLLEDVQHMDFIVQYQDAITQALFPKRAARRANLPPQPCH